MSASSMFSGLETLEPRTMLSLVSPPVGFPLITYNNTGTLVYDAGQQSLDIEADPIRFRLNASAPFRSITGDVQKVAIHILVDSSGSLVGGAAGDDLVVSGTVDVDGDGAPDATDVLLTGEIAKFGFLNADDTDFFDFLFVPTGGSLLSYYTDGLIGVTTTSEHSSFADDFSVDFTGGAKGNIGKVIVEAPLPASLGDYVWFDANADGIQQNDESGVEGVTVVLTGVDANGSVSLTTQTNADGYYLFDNLLAGSYTVQFELPAGYAFTFADQGGDDSLDSDADRVTGSTTAITLTAGQDDMTWDAGLVAAAVDIEKYIQASSLCGGEGFTPGYWKQCQHFDDWTGYSPYQKFNDVFGVNDDPKLTLLGALQRGGGGAAALGRHAVAALLNASHANVAYKYTVSQIVQMVRNAYATGEFETPKNLLCTQNEMGGNMYCGGKGCVVLGPMVDADIAPGLAVEAGDSLVFTYFVSNPGQVALAEVTVMDDAATSNPDDDFAPTPKLVAGYNVGDTNQDGLLDPGEVWQYTATAVAEPGQFVNTGAVVAMPVDQFGRQIADYVVDSDVANWQAGVLPPAPPTLSSLSGFVYLDCDKDGKFDSNEQGLSGVVVNLTGVDDLGQQVSLTVTTNNSGAYMFDNLRPGTYAIEEVQPSTYADGSDSLGSLGGTAGNDLFAGIVVAAGQDGINYNFGELKKKTSCPPKDYDCGDWRYHKHSGCGNYDWWDDKDDNCGRNKDDHKKSGCGSDHGGYDRDSGGCRVFDVLASICGRRNESKSGLDSLLQKFISGSCGRK